VEEKDDGESGKEKREQKMFFFSKVRKKNKMLIEMCRS
jgi:hypothetical protein